MTWTGRTRRDRGTVDGPLAWAVPLAGALLVPLAVAVAWIPIRSTVPNTDLALVLVLVGVVIGLWGRRAPVVVAAVSAAASFELFDTVPFERLAIARQPDIETTLVLLAVAVVAGELSVRTVRHRRAVRTGAETAASIRSASELLATGEELVRVVEVVGSDLRQVLGLRDCRFEAAAPDPARPHLERDGRIVIPPGAALDRGMVVELSVLGQGNELGHFVLELGARLPGRAPIMAAVTLADQVGAALMVQAPPEAPPPGGPAPVPGLRIVR